MQEDRHRNLLSDPLGTLFWWYDLMILACMFPSNSVLVFLRKNMGYRLMRPWMFGVNFLALALTTGLGAAATSGFGGGDGGSKAPAVATMVFAVLMVALAAIHRSRGWELFFRYPDSVMSMARGDSFLAPLLARIPARTIPVFSFTTWDLRRRQVFPIPEWVCQRYIEPMLLMALGLVLISAHYTVLGIWIVVSGVSVAMIESLILEKAVNTLLDAGDDRGQANYLKSLDAIASGKAAAETKAPNHKVGGLVTASPELARLRAARLQEDAPAVQTLRLGG